MSPSAAVLGRPSRPVCRDAIATLSVPAAAVHGCNSVPVSGRSWPPKSSPPMKQFITLLRMLPSMVMLSLILLFEWLTGHEL